MGQQYVASALLSKREGLFVQAFDLATLLAESPNRVSVPSSYDIPRWYLVTDCPVRRGRHRATVQRSAPAAAQCRARAGN